MKKKFKDTVVGRFLKGAVSAYITPAAGLVAGASNVIRKNKLSEQGGAGKLDKS